MDTIYQTHYKRDSSRRYFLFTSLWSGQVTRLKYLGHLARAAPTEDHHRVQAAALRPLATERDRLDVQEQPGWEQSIRRPVPELLESTAAWKKTKDKDAWRQVISKVTLWQEFANKKKKKNTDKQTTQ